MTIGLNDNVKWVWPNMVNLNVMGFSKWYEWDGLWSEENEWDGLWSEVNSDEMWSMKLLMIAWLITEFSVIWLGKEEYIFQCNKTLTLNH